MVIKEWERDGIPADPVLQALLRLLDRLPEPALRALSDALSEMNPMR